MPRRRSPTWSASLIPDVLQEPLRRKLPPDAGGLRLAIDEAADGGELQALVAEVVVESDLRIVRPPRHLAGDEIAVVRIVAAEPALHRLRRQSSHLVRRSGDEGHRAVSAFGQDALGFRELEPAAALPDLHVA